MTAIGVPGSKPAGLVLVRTGESLSGTFGVLWVDGEPVCVTLEPRWVGNEPDVSCIPRGSYQAEVYQSPRFKREVLMLSGVPGRTAVEVHVGNEARDTHGCVLVGCRFVEFEASVGVGSSRVALDELVGRLRGRGRVPFHVVGPPVVA